MRDWNFFMESYCGGGAQGGQLARFRVFFWKKREEKVGPLPFLSFFCWN